MDFLVVVLGCKAEVHLTIVDDGRILGGGSIGVAHAGGEEKAVGCTRYMD